MLELTAAMAGIKEWQGTMASIALDCPWKITIREGIRILRQAQDQLEAFDARFSRCEKLLCFVARLVLDGENGVGDAVRRCRRTARLQRRTFEHEGAFRSWVVRILMDEALAVRSEMNHANSIEEFCVSWGATPR